MSMGCSILWRSTFETQITLSTMEVKYIRLYQPINELGRTHGILKEFFSMVLGDQHIKDLALQSHSNTFGSISQSTLHKDNGTCLKFATIPKISPRTKHTSIPYHFFRSKVEYLEVSVVAINTDNKLSDQFTK